MTIYLVPGLSQSSVCSGGQRVDRSKTPKGTHLKCLCIHKWSTTDAKLLCNNSTRVPTGLVDISFRGSKYGWWTGRAKKKSNYLIRTTLYVLPKQDLSNCSSFTNKNPVNEWGKNVVCTVYL